MAVCPDKNLIEYQSLQEIVGIAKAHRLWNKYDGEVPASEYVKGGASLSLPQDINEIIDDDGAYMRSMSTGEEAMAEFEMAEDIASEKLQGAISRIDNRIKSLESSIVKSPKETAVIQERIDELNEQKKTLQDEELLDDILEMTASSLAWVRGKVFNAEKLHDNDIVQGIEELSTMEYLLDSVLEKTGFDKEGNPTYLINNKALTDKAEALIDKVRKEQNNVNNIALNFLANKVSQNENKIVTVEDIQKYKDISSLTQLGLDVSKVDNKLASYIDTLLKNANRDVMTDFSENLNIPLKQLEKEAGINLSNEAEARAFLQEDSKGNLTMNLLDEYTQEYWDFYSKSLSSINNLTKLVKQAPRDVGAREKLNNTINDFKKEMAFADVSKLTEDVSQEIQDKELARLTALVGRDKAIELRDKAINLLEKYEQRRDTYIANAEHRHSIQDKGYETEKDLDARISWWERTNSPISMYENTVGSKSLDSFNVNFIAFAPKKDSKWHDDKYTRLKGDGTNAKYKLFKFIINKLEEYKGYLPPMASNRLHKNYLPEVFKSGLLEDLKGGLGKGNFANMMAKMLSVDEGEIDPNVIGMDNQPKKSIPIKFVNDKTGRMFRDIEKDKRAIENSYDTIRVLQGKIESIDRLLTGKISGNGRKVKADEREGYKSALKTVSMKVEELKKNLPDKETKYKELVASKSLDIVQALKQFGMMAINYKYKAQVEDGVNLAMRALKKAEATEVNALGKIKKDSEGNVIIATGGSKLTSMVEYEMDALLYNQYKSNKGITTRKVGTTKEARKQLSVLRKERKQLQKEYGQGKITRKEFEQKSSNIQVKMGEIEAAHNISVNKVLDFFMNFTYLKGIGWNPLSATANVIYGKMANSIEASAGRYFNVSQKKRAERELRASFVKSISGRDSDTAIKIRSLIGKYGIMFDLLEDSYGNNRGLSEKQKKLGFINPLEMQRRGEYYNQGTVLLATLMNTTVKKKDGTEISLYDAYDINGNIDADVIENADSYASLGEGNDKFRAVRSRVLQLNKRLHGNYDPSSPMQAKQTALGRTLVMFKSWMPEGFATRFESEKYDKQLGGIVKGRYRSYATFGVAGSIRIMRNILVNQMIRNQKGIENPDQDIDMENMRRNLKELLWGLSMLGLYLVANLAFDDEDEDTTGFKISIGMLGRIQNDVTLYFNPIELHKLMKNPTPLLSTFRDIGNIAPVLYNTAVSSHSRHDADYTIKGLSKPIPLVSQVTRIVYQD